MLCSGSGAAPTSASKTRSTSSSRLRPGRSPVRSAAVSIVVVAIVMRALPVALSRRRCVVRPRGREAGPPPERRPHGRVDAVGRGRGSSGPERPPRLAGEAREQHAGDAEGGRVRDGRLRAVAEQQRRRQQHRSCNQDDPRGPATACAESGQWSPARARRPSRWAARRGPSRAVTMWPRVQPPVWQRTSMPLPSGPLPERQPVRLAAVADGGRRPEPAPLEAHRVRDEARDAARARSGVLLRRGPHLHGVPCALRSFS